VRPATPGTNAGAGAYQSLPGCSRYSTIDQTGAGGGCLWDAARFRTMSPSNEQFNIFGRVSWQFAQDHQAYLETSYSTKETKFEQNPSGVSGSWGYPGGPVNASSGAGAAVLGVGHPDNPFAGQTALLRYSAWDVGPRKSDTTNDFSRIVLGMKGKLFNWDYDSAFLHSATNLNQERTGFLRYSVMQDFLKGTNASGQNPGLAFWRIGQNSGLNSPALYSALSPTISSTAYSAMDILDFKASRDLFNLPGGPMGLALGVEYRSEQSKLTPTTYTDQGDIVGLGFSAYDGKRNVTAVYGEVLAPVLKQVELSAALRSDSYSNGISSTTPKLGIKITPIRTVALRATYAEGFRAPNPAEAGTGGGLAAFTTARDPVRCPVTGLSVDCAASIAIITTPNPALVPEKSKSATLGAIWDVTRNTSISVDYWEITRSNEINQITATQAIAGAGTVTRSSNNDLPGIPNSGTLLAVSAPYTNSAKTDVKGYDVDFRQRLAMGGMGNLLFDFHWVHITSFLRHETDGTSFEFAGTHGNCDVTNCIGTPKDRVNAALNWDRGDWRWTAIYNYRGPIQNRAFEGDACANSFADGTDAPTNCKLPSFYTVDLSFRWRARKQIELFGSIQNLFDKVAPLDPLTYGAISYNPLDISGAVGRFYTLGLRYQFR